MSHAAVILTLSLFVSSAGATGASAVKSAPSAKSAADCADYLKAANEYEELVDGLIVQKKSVFDLTDWSPNSDFGHILATEKTPESAVLQIEIPARNKKGKPTTVSASFKKWDLDPAYRRADFDPIDFFAANKKAKSFVLILKNGTDVLCRESRKVSGGD